MAVPMTGEEIDREYQRAAMRAEELESLAAGLRRLSGEEYESALSDIRCAWRGESAQQYLRRANELSQEIMHCSAELLMSAQSLWDAVAEQEATLADTGRILVRPSGTEALIRVMVEAQTEENARKIAEKLANIIKNG